jgi:hypothetical protein
MKLFGRADGSQFMTDASTMFAQKREKSPQAGAGCCTGPNENVNIFRHHF